MKRLTTAEVHAQKVSELGLDPNILDLTSIEAIAGALRRLANFLCPCSAATLVRGVVQPMRGLVENRESFKVIVEDTLEAMIAYGDILEFREVEENLGVEGSVLLYAAPVSFVPRKSGMVILIGIATDQLSALPEDLEVRIEYVNHVRRLTPKSNENLHKTLIDLGFNQITSENWLKSPPFETSDEHVKRLEQLLDTKESSRDVTGLLLLEPKTSVRYYRGRWVNPHNQSGRFVARRSQAYGADLWCYVQLRNGNPERLLDFPTSINSLWRGCDEAWRLQMAIDAKMGKPQQFRLRQGQGRMWIMEFFSPVPAWARRQWDAVGEPIPSSGCLFAYRFNESEIEEELRFARESLWLDDLTRNV
jgi:hypothetical protein